MTQTTQETLQMTFPCVFPLKVMAVTTHHFESDLLAIVRKHVPNLAADALVKKPSKTAKYTAFTITFSASSRQQLDDLYREINKHPDVRMVL